MVIVANGNCGGGWWLIMIHIRTQLSDNLVTRTSKMYVCFFDSYHCGSKSAVDQSQFGNKKFKNALFNHCCLNSLNSAL